MYGHVTITIDAVMMFPLGNSFPRTWDVSGDIVIIVPLFRQISIGATTTINNSMYLDNREAEVPIEAELGLITGIILPPDHGLAATITKHVESVAGESTPTPISAQP